MKKLSPLSNPLITRNWSRGEKFIYLPKKEAKWLGWLKFSDHKSNATDHANWDWIAVSSTNHQIRPSQRLTNKETNSRWQNRRPNNKFKQTQLRFHYASTKRKSKQANLQQMIQSKFTQMDGIRRKMNIHERNTSWVYLRMPGKSLPEPRQTRQELQSSPRFFLQTMHLTLKREMGT